MRNGFLAALFGLAILAQDLVACQGSSSLEVTPSEVSDMDLFQRFGGDPNKLSSSQLVAASATAGTVGDWVKLLRVDTDDGKPVLVNVNLRAEYSISGPLVSPDGHTVTGVAPAPVAQTGSPLVARIRWGLGGASQTIDFDIPPPRVFPFSPGGVIPNRSPVNDAGDGVSLCLSGSAFEVQVRNDGNLNPIVGQATNTGALGNLTPAKVSAFISPGTGANVGPVRRDIVCATTFIGIAAGASVNFLIPSFARHAWFPRSTGVGVVPPLTWASSDAGGLLVRQIPIPTNFEGPIEVFGWEQSVTITNNGANALNGLIVSFDVNPN